MQKTSGKIGWVYDLHFHKINDRLSVLLVTLHL